MSDSEEDVPLGAVLGSRMPELAAAPARLGPGDAAMAGSGSSDEEDLDLEALTDRHNANAARAPQAIASKPALRAIAAKAVSKPSTEGTRKRRVLQSDDEEDTDGEAEAGEAEVRAPPPSTR
mmetsp:Transcript_38923/g.90104  ORF Transcript_38923/g.90104 Transcript_38923/m.90104 type:complete len:122 (+) Transcript_38923:65-430(+)